MVFGVVFLFSNTDALATLTEILKKKKITALYSHLQMNGIHFLMFPFLRILYHCRANKNVYMSYIAFRGLVSKG